MSDGPDNTGEQQPGTPPGWYQDSQGVTRWWDGTQWGQAAESPPPAPPAPPGFDQPAAQPYGAPTTLDAGAAFSYSWQKFQEYWKEFIVMVLVVAAVSLVGVVLALLALLPTLSGDSTSIVIGWVAYSVVILVVLAISFVVQAGIYRAGLGVTKGVAPSVGMLVERTNLGTYIGTVLLIALASTIGLFLCVLPGLAVLFFTAYAPLIALDKGVGPVEAIRRSVELVQKELGRVFLVLLLAYAVYSIGTLACYVGLLVSIPVALVMITYSYRVLENEPVAP